MTVDITLFGATGYTGSLTARYLAGHLPAGATWAIAGRNRDKLESLAAELGEAGTTPEVVVADQTDAGSLHAMVNRTRVLISTVGPYLTYGAPVVQAAAEAGITYLDLTGEPQFVDQTWLAVHDLARETGAKLIHACGFDSVPYDLGVLFTVGQLPDDEPIRVRGYVRAKITPSGGTYHSAIGQFSSLRESARIAKQRREREPRPEGRRIRGAGAPGRAADGVKGFGVPLPTLDPQIVLRSARALPSYGPDFTYEHYAHFHTRRMIAATAPVAGALFVGSQIPPVRSLLLKAKAVGSGPSEEERAKHGFTLTLVGEAGERRVVTTVTGRDPGYGGTAVMLAESALCAAFDDLPRVSGQTTTAVALGTALITRLQNSDSPLSLTFETVR